ncbi:TIGR00725 family protein [Xanthobacteraceae bacterium A53D]
MSPPASPAASVPLLWSEAGDLTAGDLVFDAWALAWRAGGRPAPDARQVTPVEALRLLAATGRMRRVPVGIIGPKNANAAQAQLAEALGRAFAKAGLTLLTGGRKGVMEAASCGAFAAGGITIGIIPDDEWGSANPYVTIPLATGLGPARNAIVARACEVLVAVGGEYGTLSEMAFGMHFNRKVLAMLNAPVVPGAIICETVDEALGHVAARFLRLDSPPVAG